MVWLRVWICERLGLHAVVSRCCLVVSDVVEGVLLVLWSSAV